MSTLHVTNGDSVAGNLLKCGFTDPVLPWRDVLHDGPVPAGDAAALARVRASFLASRGAARDEVLLADFTGRDATLAAAGAGDNIVLWFEPDLYDQLQLLQILARLYLRPAAERPLLEIVPADTLLGTLKPERLPSLHDARRAVREADLELAAEGWEAFTAAEPMLLAGFGRTETAMFEPGSYASDPDVVLPYVHPAVRRQLEEYPSAFNGVSRTEQQILAVLAGGERTVGETYAAAHAPKEEWIWLGDWSFAWYIEQLASSAVPLVVGEHGRLAPASLSDVTGFFKQRIRLSDAGREVREGTADAIALNGIDRWTGGVHHTTEHHWRWDAVNDELKEIRTGVS